MLVSTLLELIKTHSSSEPIRILNVGYGPAEELQRLIRALPEVDKCVIHLIDFSEETIEYAKDRLKDAMIETRRLPTVEFIQDSVHNLIKEASRKKQSKAYGDYDFVYCAGLFDYLSDKVCMRLLKLFCSWVKPSGKVLATNVHPSNPHRGLMEHLLEWYLIYRDENDVIA